MRIVTERALIKSVLERWEAQYFENNSQVYPKWAQMGFKFNNGKNALQIRDELRLLDLNTSTTEQIVGVIGNSTWVTRLCNECGVYANRGVVVGEGESTDMDSTFLCMDCMGVVADKWCVLKELTGGGF